MNRKRFEELIREVALEERTSESFVQEVNQPVEEALRRVFDLANRWLHERSRVIFGRYEGYRIDYDEYSPEKPFRVRLPQGDPFTIDEGDAPPELGRYISLEKAREAIDRHLAKARKFEPFKAVHITRRYRPRLVRVTSIDENGREVYVSPVEKEDSYSYGNGRSKVSIDEVFPVTEANLAIIRRYEEIDAAFRRLNDETRELDTLAEPYEVSPFGGAAE